MAILPVFQTKVFTVCHMSKTSKMPCHSYSLPATACRTGAKLAKVKGSVCNGCYALKGFYRMKTVSTPRQVNLASLPENDDASAWLSWADDVIDNIVKKERSGYFRWHDSGDLQSARHFETLCYIAERLPNIRFWLPTKETKLAAGHVVPANLTVRVSSPMVDQAPLKAHRCTSTVHDKKPAHGFTCKAYNNAGKCGDCRACWDSSVTNVSYPLH